MARTTGYTATGAPPAMSRTVPVWGAGIRVTRRLTENVPQGVHIVTALGMGMARRELAAEPTMGNKVIGVKLSVVGHATISRGGAWARSGQIVVQARQTQAAALLLAEDSLARLLLLGCIEAVAALAYGYGFDHEGFLLGRGRLGRAARHGACQYQYQGEQ